MLVCLEIVGMKGGHLVKGLSQCVLDLLFNTDTFLKQVYVTHRHVLKAVKWLLLVGVLLLQVRNKRLMNLQSDLFLYLPADRSDNFLIEAIENVSLVIVDDHIGLIHVLAIPEHLQRIVDGHAEIINLIGPLKITHDHFKDKWEERPDPVDKSAPS